MDGLWSACLFFCQGTREISTFISHVLSYLWNSFRKSHDPKVIHHYLLCKLFYFEIHQSSEEGKTVCELRLYLGTNALGYSFYYPCVCYGCVFADVLFGCTVYVGVQRICVQGVGGRAGSGSWAGGLGPEVGRQTQVGAPRGSSALMASMPHLCPHFRLDATRCPDWEPRCQPTLPSTLRGSRT